jgi:hypothetical protein
MHIIAHHRLYTRAHAQAMFVAFSSHSLLLLLLLVCHVQACDPAGAGGCSC